MTICVAIANTFMAYFARLSIGFRMNLRSIPANMIMSSKVKRGTSYSNLSARIRCVCIHWISPISLVALLGYRFACPCVPILSVSSCRSIPTGFQL